MRSNKISRIIRYIEELKIEKDIDLEKFSTFLSKLSDKELEECYMEIAKSYMALITGRRYSSQKDHINIEKAREYFSGLDPIVFEQEVVKLLEKQGLRGRTTSPTRDFGADAIMVDSKGNKFVIQIKRYAEENKVGRPELQRLQGAMLHFKAQDALFVTLSHFTFEAEKYAKEHGIRLIDGNELMNMYIEPEREERWRENYWIQKFLKE